MLFFRQLLARFLKQSKGVVIVEAAFVLVAFTGIVALALDLGTAFIQQSQLERATYTAATVLRERIALYSAGVNKETNQNPPITQAQVAQLHSILGQLLPNQGITLIVDELQFQSVPVTRPPGPRPAAPIVATGYPNRITVGGTCHTELPPLNKYADLSPFSSLGRWLPLYRVTVCFPGSKSWFSSFVNSNAGVDGLVVKELVAFSIVIPR